MPMMGRGSDTRMYAPRSESETMYSSANEDGTKYSGNTPEEKEKKEENRKLRAEERKQRRDKIKHIKIRSSQGLKGEESPVPEDDSNKQDDEREISLQGGPAGSRGNLLDLATGAKTGTGSAMTGPLPIAMSEPMKGAWSSLLKGREVSDFIQQYPNIKFQEQELWDDDIANETDDYGTSTLGSTSYTDPQFDTARSRRMNPQTMDILQRFVDKSKAKPKIIQQVHGNVENPYFVPPDMKNPPLETASTNPRFANEYYYDTAADKQGDYGNEYYTDEELKEFNRRFDIQTGEPIDGAWSSLLKRDTPKSIESRRRREKRQQFRPSTGQFKRPPGGMNPVGATMRRFRARMRGIKGGKKTGLMKPHLSVEMSHRGIATKQPMSKDPQKYRQYMGQSEARKILGNVRSTFSPHARYGERSVTAGPTGAGRLGGLMPGQSGQMRQPSLKQIGVRRPRLRRPRNPVMAPAPPMGVPSPPMQAPSSISSLPQASTPMMMSEERTESDLLKGNRNLRYHKINLLRRLIAAQERAEKLGKSMQGTRSAMENGHVPSHPAGVRAKDEEDPEGPTENLETDAKRFGLDPAGYLTSKRGHMG